MQVYGSTNLGLKRKLNEDDYCVAHNENDEWMAIICDGIGGAQAGEVASHIAVITMYEAFLKSPVFNKDRDVDNWIRENLNKANDLIYSKSQKNANQRGMGTTAVGVICAKIGTYIFNVGDSRIYALYEDGLVQMSEDHSVVAQLLKENKITVEEAKVHPQRNTLTNALGVWHVFRIDINKIDQSYSTLLLSSDGLHGYVDKKKIDSIVMHRSLTLEEKVNSLIARANQAGGFDNCTVILLKKDGE
jgi:PPM family protein phosphatase